MREFSEEADDIGNRTPEVKIDVSVDVEVVMDVAVEVLTEVNVSVALVLVSDM